MLRMHPLLLSKLWPLWLAMSGFLFFYTISFPGYMSPDSFDQYHQSITGVFTDWHPPIMAWTWSLLNKFFPGPQGMLFFHLSLFWIAILLFYLRFKQSRWAYTFFILGFLPWIANFEGALWKDIGFAFSLLAAIAFIITKPLRKIYLFLSILCLLYAFMVRMNSLFAIIPIVFFMLMTLYPKLRIVYVACITVILLFAASFCNNYFNYAFLNANKTHPFLWVMENDLIHLSIQNNHSLLPGVDLALLKRCKTEMRDGTRECLTHEVSYQKISYDQEKQIWLNAIKKYPQDYLQYRLQAYSHLMRNPKKAPYEVYLFQMGDNEMGITQNNNHLRNVIKAITQKTTKIAPFLFKPYFWLLFSILLGIASFFIKRDKKTIYLLRTMLLSSIFYLLGYLPTANSADFRYIYWSVVSINFAIITYLASKEAAE
ncbi:MAG: hypothetical protein ACYCQI_04595 [Gammaproteobacteria bacterium]